jgi:hypothetical protein
MSLPIAAERRVTVREATLVQLSWTEQERGLPGALTLQLILDNGVEEYTLRVAPDVAARLGELFQRSTRASSDLDRTAPRHLTLAGSNPPSPRPARWAEASFMQT